MALFGALRKGLWGLERGIWRGAAAAGSFAERAGWNSTQSLMLRAGALYATGYAVKRYGEGYFSQEGQVAANVVGTGFQYAAATRLLRAGGREIGRGLRSAEAQQVPRGMAAVAGETGALPTRQEIKYRVKGVAARSPASHITNKYWSFPGERPYGKYATAFEYGGSVDAFLSRIGPLSLGMRAARAGVWNAKTIGLGAFDAATFGLRGLVSPGYIGTTAGFAFGSKSGIGSYKQTRESWLGLMSGYGMLKHPFAPFVRAGAAAGIASAYMQRTVVPMESWGSARALNPMNWQYANEPYAVAGDQGPVHSDLFGGGIDTEGGPSAIRSANVVEGQLAVTRKMLSMRRM